MANVDNPRGFTPLSRCPKVNSVAQKYTIASAYAANIFPGDAVTRVTGGTIERAAADGAVIGICAGVNYIDSNGTPQWGYWPTGTAVKAGTEAEILIYDDPDEIFVVQVDGTGALTDVGALTDTVLGTGSALFNRSKDEVNATTATTIKVWRVVGKYESPENAWGANVDVLVKAYMHQHGTDDTLGV